MLSFPLRLKCLFQRFPLIGWANWVEEIEKSAYAPLAHNSAETTPSENWSGKKVGQLLVRLPPLPQVGRNFRLLLFANLENNCLGKPAGKNETCKPFSWANTADWMALNQEDSVGAFPCVSSCYAFYSFYFFLVSLRILFIFGIARRSAFFMQRGFFPSQSPIPIAIPNHFPLAQLLDTSFFPSEVGAFRHCLCLWLPKPL